MTRLGTAFWVVLVLAAGFTTFKVKYAVQDIEDELNRVRRHTIAEQQEIRVLTAEWTFLTQPERLAELNRRFLGLAPIAPKQLQRTIADIPLRPPAAPPDELVDALSNILAEASADPAAPQASESALSVTPAALAPEPANPATQVQLVKAGPDPAPNSLDALIAQIADTR